MSRVYFHSPSGRAELGGAERAWLDHLASGPAQAAWDLDSMSGFDRAKEILSMVSEVPDGKHGANYLHTYLREAVAQDKQNSDIIHRRLVGRTNYEPMQRLVSALRTSLNVNGLELNVGDTQLNTGNVDLNTALAVGSDPIALAAKIHGWCEIHCWVEGPDRAWLADIIEQGLDVGIYRAGMGWEGPSVYDKGVGVVPLLRSRDDEPVVLSYSVCDQFPNVMVGDWMPPWPDGVEKIFDHLPEDEQVRRSARDEEWSELSDEEQWRISMQGLRSTRSWAQLSAATLRAAFHHPVHVYDLLREDRDDRVRSIVFRDAEQPA